MNVEFSRKLWPIRIKLQAAVCRPTSSVHSSIVLHSTLHSLHTESVVQQPTLPPPFYFIIIHLTRKADNLTAIFEPTV
jgi:hypothetical protein